MKFSTFNIMNTMRMCMMFHMPMLCYAENYDVLSEF